MSHARAVTARDGGIHTHGRQRPVIAPPRPIAGLLGGLYHNMSQHTRGHRRMPSGRFGVSAIPRNLVCGRHNAIIQTECNQQSTVTVTKSTLNGICHHLNWLWNTISLLTSCLGRLSMMISRRRSDCTRKRGRPTRRHVRACEHARRD